MPTFRKKPVVIEAWQWNGERMGEMRGVCQCSSNTVPHLHTAHENSIDDRGQLVFLTRGDWIIPEAKKAARYYPCKPDVLAETYEPAEPIRMPELTPEQQKAFEEEWSKPAAGYITWLPDPTSGSMKFDPGPAIGEHLTDIDADEQPSVSRLYARIRDALETIVDRYSDLEAQLQAEGEHTEAANAEIERLRAQPLTAKQAEDLTKRAT